MSTTAPGWYPDPYRRHESRYWDGGRWTEHVSDRGGTAVDPTEGGAASTGAAAAPVTEGAAASEVPPEPDLELPPTTTWQSTPPAPPEPPAWRAAPTPPPGTTPPSSWGAPPSNVPPQRPWGSTAPGGAWSPTAAGAPVDTRDRLPAIVGLVGAVVLVVAAFLPWFTVSIDFAGASVSEDVSGIDGSDGVIIIVLAVAAGVFALLRVLGKGPSQLGIGMAVAGLLALLIGLVDLGNKDPDTDAPLAALVDISPSVGLWLVIVGGLVVAVAGVLVLLSGRSRLTAA